MASSTVTSGDGTRIAFSREGSGPALVLVDAAGGFRGFGPMPELASALAPRFTVITYDRRGRGESGDVPPYAVDREVDDLGALIEAAGGRAFVHGFSSGAVLALHAAARGLPIPGLSLLEPPLDPADGPSTQPDPLELEVAELVASGRRGDAVEHFNRSIGVPDEYLVGMRDAPVWPALEALAHTLVYDAMIARTGTAVPLSAIATPTLVINSDQTDDRIKGWAAATADILPHAVHRALPGEWHGVAPDVLGPELASFFGGD